MINRNIKKTTKRALYWILAFASASALIFIIVMIWRVLFDPVTNTLQSEQIVTLCLFILAIITILSWPYYKLIEANINSGVAEDFKRERMLSHADMRIAIGVFHMHLYRALFSETTQSNDKDGKAKKEIDSAIEHGWRAFEILKSADGKGSIRHIYLIKNNMAYYLARKWSYFREAKDDDSFKNYLNETNIRLKEYRGDKLIAEELIADLVEKRAARAFPELADSIADTIDTVATVFSV